VLTRVRRDRLMAGGDFDPSTEGATFRIAATDHAALLLLLELTRLTSVLHLSSVEDVIQIFCSGDRAIESVAGAVA